MRLPAGILSFWAAWKIQFLIGAGCLIAFGFALKYYGNRQYAAGRQEERTAATQQLQKAVNEAVAVERAKSAQERATIAEAKESLDRARQQFSVDQKRLSEQFRTGMSSIENTLAERNSRVIQTPADDRSDVVRALNARLRPGAPAAQPAAQ